MKEVEFTIVSNDCIAPDTYRMVLEGDTSAIESSGQFVEVSLPGYFLRRPISVNDRTERCLTLAYKVVGKGTDLMSGMTPGDTLVALTGLGHGFNAGACKQSALLLGGGLGAAPLYLLARELMALGREVSVVLGFGKAEEIVMQKEFEALGAKVFIATMDGSRGTKGFVTDVVKAEKPVFDRFYACGPKPMLKAVCQSIGSDGEVSMEERMGCGFGICYGCTLQTAKGPRRVCKDGPVFDKEDLIWE